MKPCSSGPSTEVPIPTLYSVPFSHAVTAFRSSLTRSTSRRHSTSPMIQIGNVRIEGLARQFREGRDSAPTRIADFTPLLLTCIEASFARLASQAAHQRLGLRQSSGAFAAASAPARGVEKRRRTAALQDALAYSQPKGQAPVLPHPGPLPLGEGESGSVAGQAGRVVLQQARRMVLPPPAGEGWGGGERVEFPLASCAPHSALETKRQRLRVRQSSGAFTSASTPARTVEKRRKTAALQDASAPFAAPAFVAQTFLSAVSPTFQSARRRSRPAVRGLENPRYSRLESLRYALATAQASIPLKRRDAENAEKAERNETPSPSASLCVLRASALNSPPVLQLSAFGFISDFGFRTSDFIPPPL